MTAPLEVRQLADLATQKGRQGAVLLLFDLVGEEVAVITWGQTRPLCQVMASTGEQILDALPSVNPFRGLTRTGPHLVRHDLKTLLLELVREHLVGDEARLQYSDPENLLGRVWTSIEAAAAEIPS